MTQSRGSRVPIWSVLTPVAACVLLGIALSGVVGTLWVVVLSATLIASVLTAVHHAEVVAHRTGEPFGTLILAIAVRVLACLPVGRRRDLPDDRLAVIAHDHQRR